MVLQVDPSARAGFGASPEHRIFRILRDGICRNRIPTGTRILLTGVSDERGSPPETVAGAFVLLTEDGLVDGMARDQVTVLPISERRLRDTVFLREQTEAEIVRRVARAADTDLLTELREQILRQKLVGLRGPRDLLRLDNRFHRTLAERAGLGSIWPHLEAWKLYNDRVRFAVERSLDTAEMISQHSAIVDRIALQDAEGAAAAMRYHASGVLRKLSEYRASQPDQFCD